MGWTYILECSDGSYYVGSTTNLEKRVEQHLSGLGGQYTSRRLPVKLVFAAQFESIGEAYRFEKQIQGWRRAKKEALIMQKWDSLPELSRKDWRTYRQRHDSED